MGRDDREVFYVEREGGGAFKWLLIGAALGAGAAFLFAPRTGSDLRKELGRGIKRLRSLADDTIEELQDEPDGEEEKLRSMSDEAWEGEDAEDLDEDVEEEAVAGRPSRSAERPSARQELERRLEQARARRRRKPAAETDDEEPGA